MLAAAPVMAVPDASQPPGAAAHLVMDTLPRSAGLLTIVVEVLAALPTVVLDGTAVVVGLPEPPLEDELQPARTSETTARAATVPRVDGFKVLGILQNRPASSADAGRSGWIRTAAGAGPGSA